MEKCPYSPGAPGTTRTLVPIADMARRIKLEGPTAMDNDPEDHIKTKFYRLLSVVIDHAMDKALEQKPILSPQEIISEGLENRNLTIRAALVRAGNLQFIPGYCYFPTLLNGMKSVLIDSFRKTIAELSKGSLYPENNEPIKDTFNSLLVAHSNYANLETLTPQNKLIKLTGLLSSGIRTASHTMVTTIATIDKMTESSEETFNVARNSFGLVGRLAMLHIYDLSDIRDHLTDTNSFDGTYFDWNKNLFTLAPTKNGKKLALKEDLPLKGNLAEGRGPRVGCPAMVNFGDGSAVHKLWDWFIEVAEATMPKRENPTNQKS